MHYAGIVHDAVHSSQSHQDPMLEEGEEPAGSLHCGFAFAFDRHAKSFAFTFNAYSSH